MSAYFDPIAPVHGVFPGLSMKEYRTMPGISAHLLKKGCPEIKDGGTRGHISRIYCEMMGQRARGEKKTRSQSIGSLYHTLLLEPDRFSEQYSVVDETLRRELLKLSCERKASQAPQAYSGRLKEASEFKAKHGREPNDSEKAEILALAQARSIGECEFHPRLHEFVEWSEKQIEAGREIVSEEDLALDRAMVEAVWTLPQNRQVAGYLESIKSETVSERIECSLFTPFQFKSSDTAIQLKGRPDLIPNGPAFLDPKSTNSAHPTDFAKSVVAYGYAIQAGFYCLISELLQGHDTAAHLEFPKTDFGFLAQETAPPYLAKLYWLPSPWLKWGKRRAQVLLRATLNAHESGDWSGAGSDFEFSAAVDEFPGETLEPPEWLMPELEQFQ